jgi:hypothetical protein
MSEENSGLSSAAAERHRYAPGDRYPWVRRLLEKNGAPAVDPLWKMIRPKGRHQLLGLAHREASTMAALAVRKTLRPTGKPAAFGKRPNAGTPLVRSCVAGCVATRPKGKLA